MFIHLVPVFVAIGAITLLDEHPQLFHAAGITLIPGGVFPTTRRRRMDSPDEAAYRFRLHFLGR